MNQSKTTIGKITGRFRSTVNWAPSDWEKPLDALVKRINDAHCRASLEGLSTDSLSHPPIEFTADQWAILAAIERVAKAARLTNNMPAYRKALEEYEDRVMEFLRRSAADRKVALADI